MRIFFITFLIAISLMIGCSSSELSPEIKGKLRADIYLRGWDRLAKKLEYDGISQRFIYETFSDPRMPEFKEVSFKLKPRETHDQYSQFRNQKNYQKARQFINSYYRALSVAENTYKVPKEVIAAIINVESNFGQNTGSEMILNRLSRVANIGEPQNLEWNYLKLKKEDSSVTFDEVSNRAKYLENTFYPEVRSLFKIAEHKKIDIFNIKGSYAGAFGIPQFLPSSYFNYAVDGNNDGDISLYNIEDAIFSVANYLSKNGWKEGISKEDKRKVIWSYNKSDPYISTILHIADSI